MTRLARQLETSKKNFKDADGVLQVVPKSALPRSDKDALSDCVKVIDEVIQPAKLLVAAMVVADLLVNKSQHQLPQDVAKALAYVRRELAVATADLPA
eukprot:13006551-Alexandrium_andersonii.AAC.1